MLLKAAKCKGYSIYHFWVITVKTTGGVKIPPATQIRVKRYLVWLHPTFEKLESVLVEKHEQR